MVKICWKTAWCVTVQVYWKHMSTDISTACFMSATWENNVEYINNGLIVLSSNIEDLIRYTLRCPLNCKYCCKKCSHEFKAAKQFIKYKFTPTFNEWLRPMIQPQKSHLFCLTQFIHFNLLLHVVSICKIVYAKKWIFMAILCRFSDFFHLNIFNNSFYVHDVNYVVNKMKLQFMNFLFSILFFAAEC